MTPPVAPMMRERPDIIHGKTYKLDAGEPLFVTINEDEHGMFEVFATIGKSGGFTSSFTEAIGRLVSLCLRCGVPPLLIAKQLVGIRSPRQGIWEGKVIWSVPDGVGRAMLKHLGRTTTDLTTVPEDPAKENVTVVAVDDEMPDDEVRS